MQIIIQTNDNNMVESKFVWIPLGVEGGLTESNLNAHLFAPVGSTEFVCVDAGTILVGLKEAWDAGCFYDIPMPENSPLSPEGIILHRHIKAYLITHAYLDHTAGLVMISPNDLPKPVISLKGTIDDMREHLFNWRIWPNFADRGTEPALGMYRYTSLPPGEKTHVENTRMNVEVYPLAHGPQNDSAAFLIESDEHYLLYMGDTGPDDIEKRSTTRDLWKRIAPLVKEKTLHAIFIEASYPDERPDDQLFSHLTPAWIMRAFQELAAIVDPHNHKNALAGLKIVIMHVKPEIQNGDPPLNQIRKQLRQRNDLGLQLIFAKQARRMEL